MRISDRFFDTAQAKRYLVNSIIRYKDTPVEVIDIVSTSMIIRQIDKMVVNNPGLKLYYNSRDEYIDAITSADNIYENPIDLRNRDINFSPIQVGMINDSEYNRVRMCYRTPSRQWKQGLSIDNTKALPIIYNEHDYRYLNILSRDFLNMLQNKYLPISWPLDCKESTQAISKNFAYDGAGNLYYKTFLTPVGSLDQLEIHLSPTFSFLREILTKEVHDADNNGHVRVV